ncbi:uncharacterized protein [Drosophila kikkawai]|uniref:F-box domain-containing protein n=1 Tax=Drosophila kikkawai TaxID=30033 RepID=A0A6P4IKI3_DROKI|nr:uncharacterized protein LOC108075218 isoform X1 [Drosophila kikkawai]
MLTIIDLNDDCLLNILKYLSLSDHVNLSKSNSRFFEIIMDQSKAIYPTFHTNKPVLYYTKSAVQLFRVLNNNVRTLGVIQGHYHDQEELGNAVRDFRILSETRNKINFRSCWKELPGIDDMFRFSSLRSRGYLSVNIPSCLCYMEEFFRLIPNLRELRVSGFAKCSESVSVIARCFPQLDNLSIRGASLKNPSDFELISQIKNLTKLALNVGGQNSLAPLTKLTELRSLYLESMLSYISAREIIEIIENCRKLEFLYCYYIDHADQPHSSIANIFRAIKSSRDPSTQKPLELYSYLDPPLSDDNKQLIDNAYFVYRRL